VLCCVIPAAAVIGLLLAARLKAEAPVRFNDLGNHNA
jgi:hypothetical protein